MHLAPDRTRVPQPRHRLPPTLLATTTGVGTRGTRSQAWVTSCWRSRGQRRSTQTVRRGGRDARATPVPPLPQPALPPPLPPSLSRTRSGPLLIQSNPPELLHRRLAVADAHVPWADCYAHRGAGERAKHVLEVHPPAYLLVGGWVGGSTHILLPAPHLATRPHPPSPRRPMLVVATLSAIIASQALISGAFTIVQQAMTMVRPRGGAAASCADRHARTRPRPSLAPLRRRTACRASQSSSRPKSRWARSTSPR